MYLATTYARRGAVAAWGAALAAAALALGSSPAHASAPARASGDVDVLSAGSLNTLMNKKVAGAFHRATGYTLVDTSGGSSTLASDIKNKVDVADVFVSASPKVTQSLAGKANGDWVSWYGTFAESPYVLAYAPKSKYASALRSEPWYKVISQSGFRLGRTNPSQDPGGKLAVTILDDGAKTFHIPALHTLATESSDEYEETTEQAGIENGQLDGSFMYEADANSQSSPFVKLSGVPTQYGQYTISLVRGAPHPAAAVAFVKFLLGSQGRALLAGQKFTVISPARLKGTAVPSTLSSLFKR